MKKFLVSVIVSMTTIPCIASANDSVPSQPQQNANYESLEYIQREIMQLEQELAQKKETLDKCAKKNKNFKIAGITTVGLTGVGRSQMSPCIPSNKTKKNKQNKQYQKYKVQKKN